MQCRPGVKIFQRVGLRVCCRTLRQRRHRSFEGRAHWRAVMTELARCSNLMVKLSGLSTFDRACSTVIEETVGLFGPNRCLFGSSFSFEKLWTDYASLVGAMRTTYRATPSMSGASCCTIPRCTSTNFGASMPAAPSGAAKPMMS